MVQCALTINSSDIISHLYYVSYFAIEIYDDGDLDTSTFELCIRALNTNY